MSAMRTILREGMIIRRPLLWAAGAMALGELAAFAVFGSGGTGAGVWPAGAEALSGARRLSPSLPPPVPRDMPDAGHLLSFHSLILSNFSAFLEISIFLIVLCLTGAAVWAAVSKKRFWKRQVKIFRLQGARRCALVLGTAFLAGVLLAGREIRPSPEERFAAQCLAQTCGDALQARVRGQADAVTERFGFYTVTLKNCRIESASGSCRAGKITVRTKQPVEYGDMVLASGELTPVEGPRVPGEFDYRSYYRSQGIRMTMDADSVSAKPGQGSVLLSGLVKIRKRAGEILSAICGGEDAGLLRAMVLGDKGQLDKELRALYQDGGIAHLMAISGLHASLVGMTVYGLLRRMGAGFWGAGAAAGGILLGYGFMAGFGASVFRAVFMLLARFLAECLGRTYDALTAMALAAILLMADSPYLLLQSGFQLSFGAVLAIAGAGKVLRDGLPGAEEGNRFSRAARDAVIVGAAVQMVTFPVVLYHFFQYPPYGFFLNFLVIPAMTYVLLSGILGILAGAVSIAAGELMVGSAHYILVFYHWLLEGAASLPGNVLVWGRPAAWELACYYGGLSALLLGVWLRSRPGAGKRCGRGRFSVLFLAAFLAGGSLLMYPRPPRRTRITFLDVGQGDGCLIRGPAGAVLVDGGSSQIKKLGENRLEPFLKSQGIRVIDGAVVSHGDSDHVSGLVYLLEECREIQIKTLILPDYDREGETYGRLAALASSRGTDVRYMSAGGRLTLGDTVFTCLHPSAGFSKRDINEQSLVLRMECGGLSVLFAGDIEDGAEKSLLVSCPPGLLRADILKAAHHGSRTSSGLEFLRAAAPKMAVLSYGAGNSYGHPSPEVTDRMRELGIVLWETAEHGAIAVTEENGGWEVEGFASGENQDF